MDSSSSSLPTVTIDKSMCESPETTSVLLPPTPKQDEVRGHSTIAPATTERFQLEDYTPFSRSHLWKLMMSFYDRQGVDSWAHGIVPHFITSNTFIAKKYSQVFRAYLRDCMRTAALNPKEPLYIVELGTGSGKFSFYFLKALAEAEDVLDFPLDQIKYIMTDFTEQNFTFWTTHPALAPFVSRGMVDFAIFDATNDTELSLFHAKYVIQPHQLVNPIAIIANYLFDTLYHDLFQVDLQGVLKQGLISVGSKRSDESDPLHPDIIKRLFNLYKYEPIPTTFYGSEAIHLNAILQWYQDYYKDSSSGATLLVPIGALSAIERLSRLSQQERVVILSGDKGNNHPEHFRGLNDPHIAVHGSFSVMVNYHAIGIYCTSRGGFALHSPQEEASLKVSVFVLPGKNDTSTSSLFREGLEVVSQPRRLLFPHLVHAFEEDIVSFGPNDFFVLQKALKEESKTPSLKAVVALLKLSEWDPDTFYKFRDVLLDHSPSSAPKLKRDVARGMPLVWKNYYALDREKDIAFEIGRFFYGLQQYETALTFYQRSLDEMGLHHVTCHNMGLCYYSQRQLSIALSYFKQAHGLNPSYTKAATWWTRVQTELGQLAPTQPLTPQHPEVGEGEDLIEFVLSDHEEEQARSSLSRVGLE